MIAKSNLPTIVPERVRVLISESEWFASRQTTSIVFKEEKNPYNDPSVDDYLIAYEAFFEPESLEQAYVWISVSTDGSVGIGIERWKRLAERLNVSIAGDEDSGIRVVGGVELSFMNESALLAILDLIANGQLAISPIVIPFFGLISTKVVVSQNVFEELISKDVSGNSAFNWLTPVSQLKFTENRRLLHFNRWK
jgi:hypothetical protein